MEKRLRLVKDGKEEVQREAPLDQEERLRIWRNMTASMMDGALDKWTEIYKEFEGQVVSGVMVEKDASEGFVPECGWPEFLERMWSLHHYLDQMKRICEGKA